MNPMEAAKSMVDSTLHNTVEFGMRDDVDFRICKLHSNPMANQQQLPESTSSFISTAGNPHL
jgi:hypothetical protein